MKGKYLITTDNWFVAPDGKSYRAVWGEVHTMTAVGVLGVEPNRNSANWMVKVGSEEHHMVLAGCQIHYAVSCPERPNQEDTLQKYADDKEKTLRDNCIYIPEPSARKDIEIIDGKEVEWSTNRDTLVEILSVNPNFLKNSMLRENIANIINNNDFIKYRYYRPIYGAKKILEIVHKNGEIIKWGN